MSKKNNEYFDLIESFIDDFRERHGYSPTVRDIESGTGISKSTVGRYIAYMRDQGMLDYSGHRNVITKQSQKIKEETVRVPVLGSVSCGIPKYAEENIEEYVRLPVALFGHGDFFFLRASGDSMIEAGIDDDDLVLIKKQSTADPGQIVIALMDDEATLKRYYPEPENNRIRLHPENKLLEDIYVNDCIIQGIAVKVIKDII